MGTSLISKKSNKQVNLLKLDTGNWANFTRVLLVL